MLAILKVIGVILLVPKFGYLASAALFAGSYIVGTSISAWKTHQVLAARQAATQAPVLSAPSSTDAPVDLNSRRDE